MFLDATKSLLISMERPSCRSRIEIITSVQRRQRWTGFREGSDGRADLQARDGELGGSPAWRRAEPVGRPVILAAFRDDDGRAVPHGNPVERAMRPAAGRPSCRLRRRRFSAGPDCLLVATSLEVRALRVPRGGRWPAMTYPGPSLARGFFPAARKEK